MSYELQVAVGPVAAKVEEDSPQSADLVLTARADLILTNLTEDAKARVHLDGLEVAAHVPNLEVLPWVSEIGQGGSEFSLRTQGVGPQMTVQDTCDGLLFNTGRGTLSHGESESCAQELQLEIEGIEPRAAEDLAKRLAGVQPIAIRVATDGYFDEWAVPTGLDLGEEDRIRTEDPEHCGELYSRVAGEAPFCHDTGDLPRVIAGWPLHPLQNPAIHEAIEIQSTSANVWATASFAGQDDEHYLQLDLVRPIDSQCEVATSTADKAIGDVWGSGKRYVFIPSDADGSSYYNDGFAYPAAATGERDLESVNEQLVRRGLLVPGDEFENPSFDQWEPVSASNLPYAMPQVADHVSLNSAIRRYYAPIIVDLGNQAALTRSTPSSDCGRQIVREHAEAESSWSYGGGGGSSDGGFNVPGWLCPTRWC